MVEQALKHLGYCSSMWHLIITQRWHSSKLEPYTKKIVCIAFTHTVRSVITKWLTWVFSRSIYSLAALWLMKCQTCWGSQQQWSAFCKTCSSEQQENKCSALFCSSDLPFTLVYIWLGRDKQTAPRFTMERFAILGYLQFCRSSLAQDYQPLPLQSRTTRP